MGKSLRVLLVEDSEADAQLLLFELRRGGYEPAYERVDAPEEMNEALGKNGWDIVLADYVMPGFGGLAALELLKATGIDTPFIIVSGAIGEDTAVAAVKAGANDYILKGNLARLVPAVERELRDAEVRQERRKAEAERNRLSEQLRQVNAQLVVKSIQIEQQADEMEAVVTALAEAIVVYGPEGEIIRVNPMAAELLGVSPTERQKPLMELLALLDAQTEDGKPLPIEDTPPARALRGETVRGQLALVHRASDGKRIWVSISAAPIQSSDGRPRGGVAIFTDVTSLCG